MPIEVANLGTTILGLEAGGVITINQTAAGFNWYVDAASGSNQAFGLAGPTGESLAGPGSPAANDVDLLTVLEHELGHVLGLPDNDQAGDLMDITLGLGVRRSPGRGSGGDWLGDSGHRRRPAIFISTGEHACNSGHGGRSPGFVAHASYWRD